jgi:hypothetical protein
MFCGSAVNLTRANLHIETDDIMLENTIAWEENAETAET